MKFTLIQPRYCTAFRSAHNEHKIAGSLVLTARNYGAT